MNKTQTALFLGGINVFTTLETITEYFSLFGKIHNVVLHVNKFTGRNKGYGFIYFTDPKSIDEVQKQEHLIDGYTIDCEISSSNSSGDSIGTRTTDIDDTKLFISNFPREVTDVMFLEYFEAFGNLKHAYIVKTPKSGKSKCYGFVR